MYRRVEDAINGFVVTDSESDNPDDFITFYPSTTKGK